MTGRPLAAVALAILLVAPARAAGQDLMVTRVRLDSLGGVLALARAGFEVASVERSGTEEFALVVAGAAGRAALGRAGFQLRVEPAPPPTPPLFFRTPGRIDSSIAALRARSPLVTVDTIGMSLEGRPIVAVKVGPPADHPARPNVLFMATHHAREWISTEVALRLLEFLVDSLAATEAGSQQLATRDVWIVPVVNPDGYAYTFETERLWRKNRRPNADGTVGVDLNRNYPAFWGRDDIGSSGVGGAETFRGAGPASEPEVAAIIAFHQQHPPDVAVSYHSYTDLILYPYGFAPGRLAPDDDLFRALAGTPLDPAIVDGLPESARVRYHPGPGWQLYPTNGEYTEWAYRAHGTVAFTVELTAGCCVAGSGYGFQFPDDSAAISQVVRDNLPFALDLIAAAAVVVPVLGSAPQPAVFESLWPDVLVTAALGAPNLAGIVRFGGAERMVMLTADSLDRGRRRARWRAPAAAVPTNGEVEIPGLGLRASIAYRDGAEDSAAGWTGWTRDPTLPLEGSYAWSGHDDTLTSPPLDLSALAAPQLVFWNRHGGSLFQPERRGRVDLSQDGGGSWTTQQVVEGAGGEWYPVRVPLPEGATDLRVRLISEGMPWLVDAIHVSGTLPIVRPLPPAGTITVSENPVRSDRMYFSWPPAAASGDAVLSVFTFTGELVYRATVSASAGQVQWDVTNRVGAAVTDGAYVAVLQLVGRTLRRRLFVARGQ